MKTIKRTSILRSCKFDWPEELKPDYAINPYVGCAHNCSYCWARDMTYRFRRQWKIPDDFEWDKPLIVENALELLDKELKTKKPGRVLLSSMTDPYQSAEEYKRQTLRILEEILLTDAKLAWSTMILTKAPYLPERDLDLLSTDAGTWFGVTIESLHMTSWSRLGLLDKARERDIKTFVSLEPWLPRIGILTVMRAQGVKEMVDFWVIGSLNKNGKAVNPEFYKRELPPLIEWMDKEGINYYIKKELRRCVNGGMIN